MDFSGFFFRIVPYLRKDDEIIVNSDKKTPNKWDFCSS